MWSAGDGHTFLHSTDLFQMTIPGPIGMKVYVGIALDGKTTEVRRNAGKMWEAVSSRLVVTRLKWVCAGRGGSRETCDTFL